MDSFLTFLSNNYIWFLIAAAVFLFALIGLIIESAKKHKKNNSDTIESAAAPVEAFRHEHKEGVAPVAPTVEEAAPFVEETPTAPVEEAAVVTPEVAPEVTPVVEETPVEVAEPLPVEAPVIENVEGPKEPEPIEDNTFTPEPAPVMDASPVFENVDAPSENVLPEPEVVEPINTGNSN